MPPGLASVAQSAPRPRQIDGTSRPAALTLRAHSDLNPPCPVKNALSPSLVLSLTLLIGGSAQALAEGPPQAAGLPSNSATSGDSSSELDQLYQTGQQLFETFAPPEVKAQYEFPTKEQWNAFAAKLQAALQSDSFQGLADYAPPARAALTTLRNLGADDELADWLEQRLDEAEAARQIQSAATPPPSPPISSPPAPPRPGTPMVRPRIPYYDLWLSRVRTRPVPVGAAVLMPSLQTAFADEGVPESLAWVAEAESSLNPNARSPAGAKGLFQLMPDTAKNLGLSTFLPDERTNPEKSAHAAARYLHELHDRFGSWPLALAAYNAGAGRVSRALMARHANDFAAIADTLPAETRMYVPKVCALISVRTGKSIASL